MTRDEQMQMVLTQIRPILTMVNEGKALSWTINYRLATSPWLEAATSPWDRSYHHITPGDEYFWIFDGVTGDLLYTVNVTGDSVLTAASELMNLLARKF